MKVFVAKNLGFCGGVRRAVETAMSCDAQNTFVLGELIHSREVVERVAARGIQTVQSPSEVPEGGTLLIRSHGVGRAVYEECERRNIKVIDCTCPFVKKTQEIVCRESAKGKVIVIAGHRGHAEVEGLVGWCEGEAFVVSSEEELPEFGAEQVVLVAQTTFSEKVFCKIGEILRKRSPKTVEIFSTICYTTAVRQNEAEQIARMCDAVLVLGDLTSSNTNRLGEIASAHCKHVYRIARADNFEYDKILFYGKVGVVAGASAPDWLTQEVLSKMVDNNAEVQETEIPAQTEEAVAPEVKEAAVEAPAAQVEAPVAPKSAMEQAMEEANEKQPYKKGSIIKVTIVQAGDDKIFVSGDGKVENDIAKEELDCEEYSREAYKARIGQEIEVMVTEVRPKVVLSEKQVKKIKEDEAVLAEVADGKEFTVVCKGTNKGGLTAELGSYPVFVPRSEIRIGYVADLEKYVGKTLRLKVQKPEDIRRTGRKEIIASQRVILEAERAAREAAKAEKEEIFFSNIAVGDIVEGKVERVTSFGAFVSVGGFDCLAHISDLSWTGVKEVTDVLTIGKKYEFKVLKVDRANKKVSIGYKQLQPQPWDLAAEKYAEGDTVHGTVVRIVPFGAFVELEKGIDGLVHVSQITHEWLDDPTKALTIGQEVDAKVIAFNPAEKKITLSIKALQPRENFEPRPEREPREEGSGRQRGRKNNRKNAQSYSEDEEYREWSDSSDFGASISELLHLDDNDNGEN